MAERAVKTLIKIDLGTNDVSLDLIQSKIDINNFLLDLGFNSKQVNSLITGEIVKKDNCTYQVATV